MLEIAGGILIAFFVLFVLAILPEEVWVMLFWMFCAAVLVGIFILLKGVAA